MYEVDIEAKILEYLPLVERVASRISVKNTEYDYDDLYNIGVIGLIDSLKKYDASKNVPFAGYATIRIKGAIIDEIRKHAKISRYKMTAVNNYYKAKQELEQDLKREATDAEIMKKMNLTSAQLGDIFDSIHYLSSISLEGTIFSGDNDSLVLEDLIQDKNAENGEENLLLSEKKEALKNAILKLNDREQLILSLYYKEEATLKEIAAILDISIARVSQLHGKIIVKLRDYIKEELG